MDRGRRGDRPFLGVRGRILAWYVVLLSLATVVATVVERQVLVGQLEERVRGELTQEVEEIGRLVGGVAPDGSCIAGQEAGGGCAVGRNPETGEPFGGDVRAIFDTFLRRSIPGEHETMVTFVDGAFHSGSIDRPVVRLEEVPAFAGAVARTDQPLEGRVETPAGPVAFLAVPVGAPAGEQGVFAVAQFLAPQLEAVDEGLQVVIVTNAVVLAIASLLASVAVGRLLRPVRLVTETAMAISESDLSQRIDVAGTDEVSRLAATFNEMLDRLADAFGAQRSFLDEAAHELRTPITIVRGNLELLPTEPAERDAVLEVVTDELDRMSRIVDDLLTLAKAQRPDFLQLGPVELPELVRDVAVKVEALAPRAWSLHQPPVAVIEADGQRLTQAVVQLVQNAVTHTEAGDRIAIGADAALDGVRIWVEDEGRGIAPRDHARIFERFARVGDADRTSGAGLGLSIVQAIADAHGGTVDVASRLGRGSRFTLVLPAHRRADTGSVHPVATP